MVLMSPYLSAVAKSMFLIAITTCLICIQMLFTAIHNNKVG